MRHPSAGCDGRGYLSLETPHWLLVGNSRWHWGAQNRHPSLCCWSESPADGEKRAAALGSKGLVAWAAVGPAPESLPRLQRITTAEVPLVGAPPWLGVDRALAGWRAWQRQGAAHSVLVADAGTALSLTRVDAGGKFAGGRLLAGAGLQLRALAQATLALPALAPEALMDEAADWPQATESALVVGIVRGLAAALTSAAEEARISEPQPCRLWLTGGDGPLLAPVLQSAGQSWRLEPDLVVEALTGLRPAPDR